MSENHIDETDQQILYLLQEDARNYTNSEISNKIGVSASTIGNRIKQLELSGVIKGYEPNIDYDKADFPLRVLFICTAPISQRSNLIKSVQDMSGIVNIKELMTGKQNIHIEVVGRDNKDITKLATALDNLGITINEEILVKNEYPRPASIFNAKVTRK